MTIDSSKESKSKQFSVKIAFKNFRSFENHHLSLRQQSDQLDSLLLHFIASTVINVIIILNDMGFNHQKEQSTVGSITLFILKKLYKLQI